MAIPNEIHLLPPRGHRGRQLALIILALAPFAFGALALALGQDSNWDLRNYHWYNAYAFLNGRADIDLLPSQTPAFYNPLLDVPFYLLATHVPAMVAGYALGFVQGLNYILLFMLAYVSLLIHNPRHKVIACAVLALLGMLGGGDIAQIGTTFYDNVTSIGLLLSALLIVRLFDRLMLPNLHAFLLAILCGVPAGLMMGLKLPAMIFCVGLCFALLSAAGPWRQRFQASFAFGIGVLLGFTVTYGHWAWFLQQHFASPFFPYFNEVFKSPLAPLTSARDIQYVPHTAKDILFFPFIFTDSPYRVGEIPWRDWRVPILYALLPLALLIRLSFGRARTQPDSFARPHAVRYLLWAAMLSYAAWIFMFAIYRYVVPIEMLAPLLIVFAVGLLPLKAQMRGLLAVIVLLVVAGSLQPGNWGRRSSWEDHFVEVTLPPLGDTSDLMVLMAGIEPYAHLVTRFPSEISFVRIQSNFSSPEQDKGINGLIRARVTAHKGRFLMLIPPWQHNVADGALRSFSLKLAPEACQTVIDRLYDDKPMDLCRIVPLTS